MSILRKSLELWSTYHLFRDDCFNIEGFIERQDAIVKKEGKLVTIINNPNHNPTGFSMTMRTCIIKDILND